MSKRLRVFEFLVVALATTFVVPASATLLLYDPFDYTAGERLGGSGTSPLGQVAPNGQQWITRSPAPAGSYVPANDTLITAGSMSYPGLASSIGNSVRYGSSADNGAGLYTDGIALGTTFTEGSVYYSMIVRLNGAVNGSIRTSYASFSTESANPGTDAGLGLGSSSGTGVPLPASSWIRNAPSPAPSGSFDLGGGKLSTDGLGVSAGAPSWQHPSAVYPNQQGNISGLSPLQSYSTIADNTYFMVLKYTFDPLGDGNDDTVSFWINPAAQTLGYNGGEAEASVGGTYGSYYSAINATVTGTQDADQIQSFVLIGQALSSVATQRSIDVSLDELRIGTTWADVTPVPEPGVFALMGLGLMGLLCSRRRV